MSVQVEKHFTKAAFRVALKCPTQLHYYVEKGRYANQDEDNEFIKALAEGGFQVGALAKVYYGVKPENDLSSVLDDSSALERTRVLMQQGNVTIAGGAFKSGNMLIRVDILVKEGNNLDLIEVKSKSWNPETDQFLVKARSGGLRVNKDICEAVYEVAYLKYVLAKACPEYSINPFLMLADRSKAADVDGINQCFRIRKVGGCVRIEKTQEADSLSDKEHVVNPFDVGEVCDLVMSGATAEQGVLLHGMLFEEFVDEMAKSCATGERIPSELTVTCFKCPFYRSEHSAPHLQDGYEECWIEKAGFTAQDFSRPLLEELWGGGNSHLRGNLLKAKKFFLDELTRADLGSCLKPSPGLSHVERKLVQIALMTNRQELLPASLPANVMDGVYLDKERLGAEMRKWKFPLHMIDFETTTVALPFYKGMRPYEQVAFQFSHHVIESADGGKSYSIRHAGQYINAEKGVFPNFEFLRELKSQLENDGGTIFRYATHENTVLNKIREQLQKSEETDKDELIRFIESITYEKKGERVIRQGERNMIDLCNIVRWFYYDPRMRGSNSIKTVLPSVLNASALLKEKYGQPIYGGRGGSIPSLNITDRMEPKVWIRPKSGNPAEIENPYKWLPDVSSYLPEGFLAPEDENEEDLVQINNGGAALTAYAKLQFAGLEMTAALRDALLSYCELDTLAMVFIWEYFNEVVQCGE